ncbi:MAG: hypothetical protein Sapg2KO_00690 [Saprospiraceae bacterium]
MDNTAKQALKPFATLVLSDSHTEEQILAFIKKNNKKVFLLPRAPFNKVDKLKPLVDAGAQLLVSRKDILKKLISPDERDAYLAAFKARLFIKGYSRRSAERFLKKGASILIDGDEPLGGLPSESIQSLCQSLSGKSKVKVSYHKFTELAAKEILEKDIRMVFCCYQDMICDRVFLEKCLALKKANLIIAASGYSQEELKSFLQKKASVIITGDDKIPINIIKHLANEIPAVQNPGDRNLKIVPDGDLADVIIDLEQLQEDKKIELISGIDWYFNVAPQA